MVTQFHYLEWPIGGVPSSCPSLIDLLQQLTKAQMDSGNKPITVMCRYVIVVIIMAIILYTRHHVVLIYIIPIDFQPSSDGMGRTGAFICMHHELERLKVEGVVDIFQCIKASRISRPYLVQNVVSPTANHHYIIIPPAIFMSLLSPPSPHTTSIPSLPLILPYPLHRSSTSSVMKCLLNMSGVLMHVTMLTLKI